MPFKKIKEWLEKEKSLGSNEPDRIVLATVNEKAIPRSRIVAIKEITNDAILFFTQLWSRKAQDIKHHPVASATLWLPLQQREVMMEGHVVTLTREENERYWKNLPRENQLRFATYASSSNSPIDSLDILNNQLANLAQQYKNTDIPMKEAYCGYRLMPTTFYFYTLGVESFSEYIKFELSHNKWKQQLLSP